ncbi:MAG: outer membrane protein transport protein, partial [Muribaculaceae bacterium]|nr:outer membrane protein transport protein [Muribaculaceae bacterium]
MKKFLLPALAAAIPALAMAQSATDAYTLSQTELRGTARFMSMGGAFTALGGDLSAVNLNPASLGVYRSSEIGATLDVGFHNFKTSLSSQNKTTAACNNFGYVGVVKLDGAMRTFAWGANYNRVSSFDRIIDGYSPALSTSLSNYVAAFTNGTPYQDLEFTDSYNPYAQSSEDWLSILAYNSYLINPNTAAGTQYQGLFKQGSVADSYYYSRERGYVDEYNFSFGGNVSDVVSWGVNIGVTDLSYSRDVAYDESIGGAEVATKNGRLAPGKAEFKLSNSQHVTGTGWNLNFGVIVRPINEFRIGLSVKTPTWWSLQHAAIGAVDYDFNPDNSSLGSLKGYEETDQADFDSRLNSPWRFNVGVAGVIGSSAIVSLDYERTAYPDMSVKHQGQWYNEFVSADYVNQDIKDYYQAANSLRVGVEYRVTPQFSLRAGYAWQSSAVKAAAADGAMQIYTSGTDPSYVFNKAVNSISVGA